MPVVYLGLGSNLGDREKNIRDAVELLNNSGVKILKLSKIIETNPVGGPPQDLFLNAAVKAETALLPQELLKTCLKVEADLGRMRTVLNGPRTIDIDILLYDDCTINTPELVIPHPRMKERDFVMRPLREIVPDIIIR
ncbi:MAG: 2-amino-4-hydroxy-6-hydroxymethyldihydropteridine diphosphokinase [Candidatus Omnitrophica bacterium]|nr:2-amino-4-hydroxy-6-hydroxymethyldihydropteridine diphosphokinase [Candidatus Omnitrophota bacterium]